MCLKCQINVTLDFNTKYYYIEKNLKLNDDNSEILVLIFDRIDILKYIQCMYCNGSCCCDFYV